MSDKILNEAYDKLKKIEEAGDADWTATADPEILAIAKDLLAKVEANENNVQQRMQDSPEPYRSMMYTLLPDADRIDGTPRYWQIVRYYEALSIDDGEPPIEDWNESVEEGVINEAPYGDAEIVSLFDSLNKVYDQLERLERAFDSGLIARRMRDKGFEGEQRAIRMRIISLMDEFDNLMPGLEMQVRGED